ncbi:MAG: hypothetical protein U0984_14650, partial [Prosthecobacter sp.]|nr:hypothetical protein [Prosthecobacter sp.]
EAPEMQRVFYGTAKAPKLNQQMDDNSATVAILGPWYDLQRFYFTRSLLLGLGLGELDIGDTFFVDSYGEPIELEYATVLDWTSTPIKVPAAWFIDARGHLFDPIYDPALAYRTLKVQLAELLQYVLDRQDDLPGGVTFAFDVADFEFTDAIPKVRTFQDRKVADLAIECLACRPDACAYFDYTQDLPELHIRSAAEETSEEVTLGDGSLFEDLQGQAMTDMVIAGVIIRYQLGYFLGYEYFRGWNGCLDADWYPAGKKADDPDVLVATVITDGDLWNSNGMAQKLYESMSVLRFAGGATVLDEPGLMAMRPGRVYTIAGDHASVPYGQLITQSASYSPGTGKWSLSFGLPAVLGLNERRDLRPWLAYATAGAGWLGFDTLPAPPGSL